MSGSQQTANGEKKSHLTAYIVISIIAAIGFALTMPHMAAKFELGGELFLRMLKMMVVPLVMASVMSGILGLGDVRKLGRPGGYAILYYLSTTILAVTVGLIMVNLISPGVGTVDQEVLDKISSPQDDLGSRTQLTQSLAELSQLDAPEITAILPDLKDRAPEDAPNVSTIINNLALMLVTDNLIKSAAETDLLPLIVFSVIFAGMLTTMGTRVKAITELITQVNDALMDFILLLMKVAPIGIFCLVTARFGEAHAAGKFFSVLAQTGWYVVTVLSGLAVHAFITLPLAYWIFTRKNPFRFMFHMSQALLTAFSTASSTATLPVTMECANLKAGVSKQSTEFVLPLGATINMDGTALYEAVAAIFIAQAIGFPLDFMQQLIIAMTATLAAIGAAGIPEAGLVTMLIVLNAVGLPVEYISLILAVDWLLDRFRTATNVLGDSIGAGLIAQTFPDRSDDPKPKAKAKANRLAKR